MGMGRHQTEDYRGNVISNRRVLALSWRRRIIEQSRMSWYVTYIIVVDICFSFYDQPVTLKLQTKNIWCFKNLSEEFIKCMLLPGTFSTLSNLSSPTQGVLRYFSAKKILFWLILPQGNYNHINYFLQPVDGVNCLCAAFILVLGDGLTMWGD